MSAVEQRSNIVLVSGPSGAGRKTAINAFEDLGFETIDNIPLALIPRLVHKEFTGRPVALGIDVRTRDFSVLGVLEILQSMETRSDLTPSLMYLDCDTAVLLRRYSETRRRHPMAPGEPPLMGIELEKHLLVDLRARADVLIETSQTSPHQLKAEVGRLFGVESTPGLAVSVQSFSYKRGIPRGVDMVLDCRFLQNPHWEPDLRALTGMDEAVKSYVQSDPRYAIFFERLLGMSEFLLPAYREEGKSHFSIGLGCTGGRHRSVAVTESLAKSLADGGWLVSIRHREMERRKDA